MGKRGPQPDPNAKQTVGIRVEPDTKVFMSLYGDSEYWRDILKVMAETKAELDQGLIDPDDFAYIAGARTAQVTGIPGDPPPDSKAYKIDTSDVKDQDHWKSRTERKKDQSGDDET